MPQQAVKQVLLCLLSDRTVVTFHLNSFQLIQVVAVFLVLHRSFAAWAVGGLLRESQEFSSIRSQTLMPSFFFVQPAVQYRAAQPAQ